jgi:hypothetical protein
MRCTTEARAFAERSWRNPGRQSVGEGAGEGCLQATAGADACVTIKLRDQAQMEAIGGCVLSRAGSWGVEAFALQWLDMTTELILHEELWQMSSLNSTAAPVEARPLLRLLQAGKNRLRYGEY